MNVEARRAYRFGYLKSEEWIGIRKIALSRYKGRCVFCRKVDWKNDVHHIRYRSGLNSKLQDLVPLCRSCHKIVHFVIEHRKRMGAVDAHLGHWRNIRRSCLRILHVAKVFGLEVAVLRAEAIYKDLEIGCAHASTAGRETAIIVSHKNTVGAT